ncbi:MAG: prepilin-type N-terminal cleavage/methylation domain-containing protein [Alphaproteobacteria bacterium]|jgi:general secretion pathway protein H|nr:prepilin-type N-terminal cleavage/methylation domain-containing protein [Alphaproteobacteria bacterium]
MSGRSRGFTLIEVLVVVTIAAVLASLVVLRLGAWRSGAEPAGQLERLAALVDYQCEQALFQSRPRGVRLTAGGYDFWQSTARGWLPVADDDVARAREWLGGAEPDLVVEDRRVELEAEPAAPQLVCQPLGELTAFNLELRLEGQAAVLVGEPGGRLAVEARQ